MDKSQKNSLLLISFAVMTIVVWITLFKLFFADSEITKWEEKNNKPKLVTELFNNWDYKEAINMFEKKWTWSLDNEEKMKLVYSYLNYWNYFYKESENSQKALDILNTMDENYEVLYYKWYANEIIKDYTKALEYYFKWIEIKWITDKKKSLLLNQIWHLYDLKWEFDKVLEYYDEAYKLDEKNEWVLSNLWRYYARIWEYDKSYDFLIKSLNVTKNMPLKSEVWFWLSSLELELNWLKPNIDKSVEFAQISIESYPNYPMWYVAFAKWLYMKNDPKYNKEIEDSLNKSINLNPNGYFAYYIYALYEADKWDYVKAKEYILKAIKAVEKDMILMDSEREDKMNWLLFDSMMIGTLKNWASDQELLMKLINKTWGLENNKIVLQIKREKFWIFAPLKDNKEFQDLMKNYNK